MNKKSNTSRGFTLLELLIAMAIFSIAMTTLFSVFASQNKSYTTQIQVVDMQQNARAALYIMEREIRMAGYLGFNTTALAQGTSNAGITVAQSNQLRFSMDIDGDDSVAEPNEDISYFINADNNLIRRDNFTNIDSILAYDIQSVGFAYAFDDDEDDDSVFETINNFLAWAVDTDGDGDLDIDLDTDNDGNIDVNDNPAGNILANDDDGDSISNVSIDRIGAVKVWILARTRTERSGYFDGNTYKVGTQIINGNNDGFRRILLSSTIKCRNMNLINQ